MLSSHELEAPFSPPLQEYDQDYTPTMPSTATFVKDSTLFPSPANGLLTPAPSPIKRKQPKSTQPKLDVKNAILPPTLGRTASASDVNAISASKATMKKQERQTSIPTFMKAGKPSTGRPRGRPRKNPIKNAPVAPAQETATLIVKPRAAETHSTPQLETISNDKRRRASSPEPARKKQKAISQLDVTMTSLTTSSASPSSYEPFNSPTAYSPTLPSPTSPLMAFSMQVDPSSGQAVLQPSRSSSSLSSAMSCISSTSTTSTKATSVHFSDFGAPKEAPLEHRKMTAAIVPGMGRVIFERSVLVERLGMDGAQKAIAGAVERSRQGSVDGMSILSDSPAPLRLPGGRAKDEQVRRWLDVEWENEDDNLRGAAFQPTRGEEVVETLAPLVLSNMALAEDEEMPFVQRQDLEELVMSQGGKSLRLLKRRKVVEDSTPPQSPTLLPPIDSLTSMKRNAFGQESACLCGDEGSDDQGMVQCDACRTWFHLACIGIQDADELPDTWYCTRCGVATSSILDDPILGSSRMAREPTLVDSSPRMKRSIQGFSSHLDYALAPSPMPANGLSSAFMHTPATGMFHSSSRANSSARNSATHPSAHDWAESDYPSEPADMSFSPRTPALTRLRQRHSIVDSLGYDEDGEREYNAWDTMLQTPSRSIGLSHDWSSTFPASTPGRLRSMADFPANMLATPRQDYTQEAFPHPQTYAAFATPEHFEPIPQNTQVRFADAEMPSHQPMARKATETFKRMAPPQMTRTNSGLGIGFGGSYDY